MSRGKRRFPLTFRIDGLPVVFNLNLPALDPFILLLFGPHEMVHPITDQVIGAQRLYQPLLKRAKHLIA